MRISSNNGDKENRPKETGRDDDRGVRGWGSLPAKETVCRQHQLPPEPVGLKSGHFAGGGEDVRLGELGLCEFLPIVRSRPRRRQGYRPWLTRSGPVTTTTCTTAPSPKHPPQAPPPSTTAFVQPSPSNNTGQLFAGPRGTCSAWSPSLFRRRWDPQIATDLPFLGHSLSSTSALPRAVYARFARSIHFCCSTTLPPRHIQVLAPSSHPLSNWPTAVQRERGAHGRTVAQSRTPALRATPFSNSCSSACPS